MGEKARSGNQPNARAAVCATLANDRRAPSLSLPGQAPDAKLDACALSVHPTAPFSC
jgi:hypothetical protein